MDPLRAPGSRCDCNAGSSGAVLRRSGPRHIRGLTFLEIEIALVFLLLGVVAVIELPSLLLEGTRLTEQQTTAAQCAQHLLDVEMALSYDYEASQVSSSWTSITSNLVPGVQAWTQYVDEQAPGYEFRVLRSDHPTLGPLVRIITVEVHWKDPNARRYGSYQIYRLTGYKTKPASAL